MTIPLKNSKLDTVIDDWARENWDEDEEQDEE